MAKDFTLLETTAESAPTAWSGLEAEAHFTNAVPARTETFPQRQETPLPPALAAPQPLGSPSLPLENTRIPQACPKLRIPWRERLGQLTQPLCSLQT